MMVLSEQIDPPPPLPVTHEERLKARIEALASDDLWVRNLIDGLAGDLREVKN